MQQGTQQTNNTPQTGSYRFTGAELAAARLVELLSDHPKIKELYANLTPNPEAWQKEVAKIAEFIRDPEKKNQFIKEMSERKPVQEMKDTMTNFIGANFEQRQIEYAIHLVTDLRLADLLKKGAQVAQSLGERLAAGFETFLQEIEKPK